MDRRKLLKGAVAGAAAAAAVPAMAASHEKKMKINMVSTWPRDFPGLGTGAQRFAKRVGEISNGMMEIKYYASGERVKAFDSFDEVASGNSQIYHGAGGQELWDKLAGNYGLKSLMCGNTGVQMGGWFRKEMNSADDFKGLKMRIPGLGGDVLSKMGASPVQACTSQAQCLQSA